MENIDVTSYLVGQRRQLWKIIIQSKLRYSLKKMLNYIFYFYYTFLSFDVSNARILQ